MGRDKADLLINNMPMLDHVLTAAKTTGYEIAIVGRTGCTHTSDVRSLPDAIPNLGPLGGLYTALMSQTPPPDILLCPCDTPGLRAEHLQWLISEWQNHQDRETERRPLALVPTWGGRDQPLFAIYASEILSVVIDQLSRKQYGMYHLITAVRARRIPLPDEHKTAVADIDTPADLDNYRWPADS